MGREAEFRSLADLLEGAGTAACYVLGPGGIGKTELLARVAREAELRGVRVGWMVGDDLRGGERSWFAALRRELDLTSAADWRRELGAQRTLVVIDALDPSGVELATIHDMHLLELPAGVSVILAGRRRIGGSATSPKLRGLTTLSLQNFDRADSDAFLVDRGVAVTRHGPLFEWSCGHPLSLELVAKLETGALPEAGPLEETPAILEPLTRCVLGDVPSEDHRLALRLGCLALWTTEDLLRLWFPAEQAAQMFTWLAGLASVELGLHGLFVHDAVRRVLIADLKWRDEPLYHGMVERVRGHFLDQLEQAPVAGYDRNVRELYYLASHATLWQGAGGPAAKLAAGRLTLVRESDWPQIEEMVRRYEGDDSLRYLRFWKERECEVIVLRDEVNRVSAFAMQLPLEKIATNDAQRDPGVAPVCEYLRQGGIEPGWRAAYFRFWVVDPGHQPIDPFQPIQAAMADRVLRTPRVALAFVTACDPATWMEVASKTNVHYFPDADFTVGGLTFGVFGHDFRKQPPAEWLRDDTARLSGVPLPPLPPLLGRSEFLAAVRLALRQLRKPNLLEQNPLVGSKLVNDRAGESADRARRAEVIAQILAEGCRALRGNPGRVDDFRILDRAYLRPAVKLEAAAFELGLPFSTFRRYLDEAQRRLAHHLWRQEVRATISSSDE